MTAEIFDFFATPHRPRGWGLDPKKARRREEIRNPDLRLLLRCTGDMLDPTGIRRLILEHVRQRPESRRYYRWHIVYRNGTWGAGTY